MVTAPLSYHFRIPSAELKEKYTMNQMLDMLAEILLAKEMSEEDN